MCLCVCISSLERWKDGRRGLIVGGCKRAGADDDWLAVSVTNVSTITQPWRRADENVSQPAARSCFYYGFNMIEYDFTSLALIFFD